MRYFIMIILIMFIVSCSWSRKIDNFLNKYIHDSVSVKSDTLSDFLKTNGVSKQDSLSKYNFLPIINK